ncbi:hypothetical protein ABIB25_003841 [Nakamurella sp. UYEF19]|uniref:M64 family metallopeptidase n=1 Tax=Nakamurella sp. UYEF19 TaxID=1756392 RepID=UPI003391BCC7
MSASDGYVLGMSKIVDHGPNSSRWNLVFVGDGYRSTELNQYRADVNAIVQQFRATPPFDNLFCGINVHRIDVVSTQSGADDPLDAPDSPAGTPTTANTYFDATFAGTGPGGVKYDRLLVIDAALALSVSNSVANRNQVICVVNSSKYGGSGGAVATCSTNTQSREIAIHEMGHTAFGLADEYGYGAGSPPGEPTQPNVTRDTNRTTNKWRALILATTPMPSSCSPASECMASTCVVPSSPGAAGVVGTFEGAAYTACNIYRPTTSCYMRDFSPFCPVCSGIIRTVLAVYLPPETVSLTTPSISFTGVPAGMGGVGVTTYRAIVWETVSCRPLTFAVTAGPTGGFGLPSGSSVTVTSDSALPITSARLWISYTSTNPGDVASGSVTVRCNETGQRWTIPLMASTISRPKAAVTLVLDRSGSMGDDAGDGRTKVQKLREAAGAFVDVMRAGDGIGLVRFDDTAKRLLEVEDAATGAGTAQSIIAGADLDPGGATSIGDGVLEGSAMLADAHPVPAYDVKAMVVLTDGQWNRPPDLASISGSITANTYAVGLGLPSNISAAALTTLCQGHNGYLLMTGELTASQSMRLSKYFLQILAGVTNANIISDPRGTVTRGSEQRIPFWVTSADYGMDLIVLSPYPRSIDFQLETPDGTRIDPATIGNVKYTVGNTVAYYRCALPVLPADANGSHAGQWNAVLTLGRLPRLPSGEQGRDPFGKIGVPYEFVAHSYSALTFDAHVMQQSFDLGATAELDATLLEYEAPPGAGYRVWAEIELPDQSINSIALKLGSDGRHQAKYKLPIPGAYSVRIRARGENLDGEAFEREKTLSAVTIRGGDKEPTGGQERSRVDRLLDHLADGDGIDDKGADRLKELGFDVRRLLQSLRRAEHPWSEH